MNENQNPMIIANGKIAKRSNHTEPNLIKAVVAWCPACCSYGGPMGKEDLVCGNCNYSPTRMYEEVIPTSNQPSEKE